MRTSETSVTDGRRPTLRWLDGKAAPSQAEETRRNRPLGPRKLAPRQPIGISYAMHHLAVLRLDHHAPAWLLAFGQRAHAVSPIDGVVHHLAVSGVHRFQRL